MNKRSLLLSGILALSTSVFAQNKNVVSALNYLGYYGQDKNCENLASAKQFIDLAANHADTKESAKMWFNRGNIYQIIADSKDEKCKSLSQNAMEEALTSFQNALKFDVKKVYEPDIKQKLNAAAAHMINKGVGEFQNRNYAAALAMFESSMMINKTVFGRVDTLGTFNAALAAEKAGNSAKAIQIYNQIISEKLAGKDGGKYYIYLANVYGNQKDSTNKVATILAGRKAHPEDLALLIEETNFYLSQKGKEKEALANLQAAVDKDPKNANLHFALANVNDRLEKFEDAERGYKKAIELKPDYFDAIFSIGALYFNKAVKITEAANLISDNTKYQKEIARADEFMKYSLPYLEKAHELNPKDRETMVSLKKLYALLEMTDKYNKITEELKN